MQNKEALIVDTSCQIELEVRVTDLNYGNHLGNDAILGYFHQGRVALLERLGFSEQDVGGAGLIMRTCQIEFLSESFLFDRLELVTGLALHGRAQCQFRYQLFRPAEEILVANGTTNMAFFDYSRHQLVRPPRSFNETLSQFRQG